MKATDANLTKINKFAQRKLTAEEVDVHQFMVASGVKSDYKTVFHPMTVAKVAHDLASGQVAFSVLHKTREMLPVGRAFDGKLENGKAYGMFYVPTETDELGVTKRIDNGTIFDGSVGIMTPLYQCSICESDIRDWRNCDHIPGKFYNTGTDRAPQMKECIITMMGHEIMEGKFGKCFSDVRAGEYSVVTDGGIPGSSVVPGTFDADTGVMDFGAFQIQKVKFEEGQEKKFAPSMFHSHMKLKFTTQQEEDESMELGDLVKQFEAFKSTTETTLAGYATQKADFESQLATKDTEITDLKSKVAAFGTALADILLLMAVKVNGNTVDAEAAKKEFAALEGDAAVAKFKALQLELEAKFPAGRQTEEKEETKTEEKSFLASPELYKM